MNATADVPHPPARVVSRADLAIAFLVCWGVAIALQWLNGAYQAEFGREPDEAAHYVTGLCVRDYLAGGWPASPLRFARNYYEHYPKVALGHWPPFFYALQSAWTLPFGPSRASVLMMMAALAAATATLLFAFLAREFGRGRAAAGALLFLSLPLVQQFSAAVMTEMAMALLTWLAMQSWARFLESEQRRDALAFGAVAGLAILTKFSGVALALAAPLALVLAGRLRLLGSLNLWLGAGVTALLAGPWTLATLSIAQEGMLGERWGWDFSHRAVPYYAAKFHQALGTGVLLMSLIGLGAMVLRPRWRRPGGAALPVSARWAGVAALMLAVILMHMIVPTGREARHLVPALVPAIALALAGANTAAMWLQRLRLSAPVARALVLLAVGVAFVAETFRLQPKGYAGFGAVAQTVLRETQARPTRVLVCSDARGEGMFIAEMAMRERRPGSVIRRGSKVLARSSWSGADHQDTIRDAEELLGFLQRDGVKFVVVDTAVPARYRRPYHELVEQTTARPDGRFELIAELPVQRQAVWQQRALRLYRVNWP
ncbi:MAG: glycosyltransferase family 39 protein [Verrucomicrobiae bacterium]|nr:glycosyltransferase family 39 protein [Verrucomicrobiae bacterium]